MARTKTRRRSYKTKYDREIDIWSVLGRIAEGLAERTGVLAPSVSCSCGCGTKWTDMEALERHLDSVNARGRSQTRGAPAPKPAAKKTKTPTTKKASAPAPTRAAAPAAAPPATSGGSMATSPTAQRLHAAAAALPDEIDASTKLGELDSALLALRYAQLRLAEAVSEYGERLVSEVWLDPFVAAAVEETGAGIAEAAQGWQEVRRRIRVTYASEIEAAQDGGRRKPRSEFFAE
ncbi:MAG TPA: hypothetical protein VKZ89_05795 [Thermobifida alba]|nr:hypothetical protein [Thermobifida alba]